MQKDERDLDIDFLWDALIYDKFVASKRAWKMTMTFDCDVLFLRPRILRNEDKVLSIEYTNGKWVI